MVNVLELFEGQLKYDDIMKMDYWLITELARAKERLLEAKAKAREKAMQAEMNKTKVGA